jgi:predicted transcriptional regulator
MLRMARRQAGLSQRAVAERAGFPQWTVARIERGQVDPRVGTLDRLLRVCGFELGLQVMQEDLAGVDRTLIREQLARSPTERVASVVAAVRFGELIQAGRQEAVE